MEYKKYLMNKIRLFYGLVSILTLLTGMLIYFLLRDVNNILLFKWILKPTFLKTILVPLKPSIFSNFIKYHLPDMLWFVSGILFLRFIWFYKIKIQKLYIWFFYCLGLVIETSQLSNNVSGTFDILDLIFMGIGAFVEGLLYKINFLRRCL